MMYDFRKHSFTPGRYYTIEEIEKIAGMPAAMMADNRLRVHHADEGVTYGFRPGYTPAIRDMQPFFKQASAVFFCNNKIITEWDGPPPQVGDLYIEMGKGDPVYYQIVGRSLAADGAGSAQWMLQLRPWSQAVPVVEKHYLCGWMDDRRARSLLVPAQHEIEARQRFVDYFYRKEELIISAGAVTIQEVEEWREPESVQ